LSDNVAQKLSLIITRESKFIRKHCRCQFYINIVLDNVIIISMEIIFEGQCCPKIVPNNNT
jgi:hypothetical protein